MEEQLCPFHVKELKENQQLLSECANFTAVAGQYHLITSQTLDGIAQRINSVAGTNLSIEGTHQYMRDIQVFKQLNLDPYSKSGVFSSTQRAKDYYDHATKGQLGMIKNKLNGTAQEIDWLRFKQGKLSSLFTKSELIGGNAPGVDGETINRLTGNTISRTTVKAAESTVGLGTNVSDVLKALEKGTLDPKDVLTGIEGTKDAVHKALTKNIEKALQNGNHSYADKLKQAQEHLKIQELNNTEGVKQSTKRLTDKISGGKGHSTVTLQEAAKKTAQGAVIGAAVGLTVSSITNYMKFKNGEITEDEAFREVGQETLKGALVGGSMTAMTLFIPGGPVGFIAGMGIGIYLNKTVTNILDEVYGKGAYAEILHTSGYIYGMAVSLEDSLKKIRKDEQNIRSNRRTIKVKSDQIEKNFDAFDLVMKGKM
ncbi:hypothetical protein LCM10_09390 [Rossellomorea aquimaris]|uniref:hypothetical protein n=1 Tax=Rossellomorea aquimaris TaxID=189382 RepID=UPI001CD20196|nr:hypothetical protein [Rossellomorea aquimaris]MCA1055200.1 hypothetical protein [Rossellomorea aquimaris]